VERQLGKSGRKEFLSSQAPVTHAYNPNYSGGRDQEDLSSVQASVLQKKKKEFLSVS
jgi:hypothetical protein